jgi:hypothetical protein
LRKNSFAISVMLLVQYGLGMGVNLYARIPAADQGAGIIAALGRALISQPVVLAVHAGLGLLMLVAGVSVLVRAIVARHRSAIASSAAGLAAIAAAAFSGATFVSNGQDGASICSIGKPSPRSVAIARTATTSASRNRPPVTPPTHDNQARQALTTITLTKAATHTMAPRVSLGLEDGAEFAEVRAVGVPDGGGQQEAASRGIRLALLLDGAISLAGSPC